MFRNRRNARDLKEYRDYSLGQRDRQLDQADRRLDLYDENLRLQQNQDARLQREADVTAQTQFNVDFFDSTVSGLDDFAVNANGAVTVGLDSMRQVLQNQPSFSENSYSVRGVEDLA